MTEAPDADDDGATEDNYAENEDPSTMGKSALASKKNSGTKRVGPKTTGDDVFDVDASDKKQRASKPSSAPRWSLNQTKGFTVNPYSKGSKSRVDIVVHDSGVPADDRKPNIKLENNSHRDSHGKTNSKPEPISHCKPNSKPNSISH